MQKLLISFLLEIGQDIGKGLYREFPSVLIGMFHKLFSEESKERDKISEYLLVVNLHEDAKCIEHILKEGFIEIR